MKKVLYIVYYYPPVGGSGVQRGVKFSRYLPASDWESIVLTPHPALLKHPRDTSLLADLPPEQWIYRSFILDARWLFKLLWGLRLPGVVNWLRYHVFIPDAEILWLPFARHKIRKIMRRHAIDLVFCSGPPFSPMLLGKWIRRKSKVPFVIDFRDDWSQGQSRLDNPPPRFFTRLEARLEHGALREADHVVVVNEAYKRDFLQLYPDLQAVHFSVITNGYDESDFALQVEPRKTERDILQIVHAGVLFGRRHPGKTWQALTDLTKAGEIDPERVRVHLYGHNFASFVFRGFESDPTIRRIVQLHPYLPHGEMLPVMLQADVLWLFSGPGAKSDAELPGKLFEYLRCAKPILAMIHPTGVCAAELMPSGLAYIADNESVDSIAEQIKAIYQNWLAGKLQPEPNWEHIRGFERRSLTRKLAQVFDQTLLSSPFTAARSANQPEDKSQSRQESRP